MHSGLGGSFLEIVNAYRVGMYLALIAGAWGIGVLVLSSCSFEGGSIGWLEEQHRENSPE